MCPARRAPARPPKKKAIEPSVETAKYSGKKLSELRKLRDQEIGSLNFEEVKIIDAAISNLSVDNTQTVLADSKSEVSQFIDDGFSHYESALEEKQRELQSAEAKLRRLIDEQFQAAKTRHIDEIADHETARSLSIDRSQKRSSAKYNLMRQQAVNLARGLSVDEAIRVRSEAENALAREREERSEAINEAFDKGLRHLLKCQVEELTVLEGHLAKGIERLDSQYQQFEVQRKQVLMASISERLRKVTHQAQAKLSRKEAFEDVAAELREFVQGPIVAEDRVFIVQAASLKGRSLLRLSFAPLWARTPDTMQASSHRTQARSGQ
jgi:uncharacterized coiled-coil protein SlyX